MKAMAQTSLLSYFNQVKPNLTERETQVLDAIKEIGRPCSTEMVAEHLGVADNFVSGRMTGLKKKRLIVHSHRGLNKRGAAVEFWTPKEQEQEYSDVS